MATKECKQWWDPYETSNRRQFIHWPNSAAEILLCPASTSFIDSYSQSERFGSTVYNNEFCWKPACKPECIRTERRNNPQPSQSFMMWRLPRDATRNSEYVGFPWTCPRSEGEIHKALTAQYSSIYRCDYMGHDHIYDGERRLAPLHSRREMLLSTETEMRGNYRQPQQKPELMGNYCRTDPNRPCRGIIVPTAVKRQTQQKRSDLTNDDRFCGKRVTNMCEEVSAVPGAAAHSTPRGKGGFENPNNGMKVNTLPPVVLHSRSAEWISSWTGPL